MTSRESGRRKYRERRRQKQDEKRAENSLFPDDRVVTSKQRSHGIRLNDLVQLRSPIRHGWVRYIGEIPDLDQRCDFFGIALKEKYKKMGKHNGTFRGINFFTAAEKSGVMCKRDKIQKVLKRSALSELESALRKLPKAQEEKLVLFAETVKKLTGLLSPVSGLNVSFESARQKSGFAPGSSPFVFSPIFDEKKDTGCQFIETPVGLPLAMSLSLSYTCSEEVIEGADVLTPGEDSIKDLQVSGEFPSEDNGRKSAVLARPRMANKSSEFLRISMRNDTLGRILNDTMSNEYSEDLKHELEEDYTLYTVSQETRRSLNSKQDVKELITNLQICINVLKKHIPKVTKTLDVNDAENTVYMTNVIQDLLKRAQEEKLSKKILTDFSGIRTMDYISNAFTASDISALVQTMAWVRNNLCIAGLTDENDAMMTLMGAEELQHSLVGILKKLDPKDLNTEKVRMRVINESGEKINRESEAQPELDIIVGNGDAQTTELDNILTAYV